MVWRAVEGPTRGYYDLVNNNAIVRGISKMGRAQSAMRTSALAVISMTMKCERERMM